jgi:hypothetical protein
MKILIQVGFIAALALLGASIGLAGVKGGEGVATGLVGGALLGLTLPGILRDIIHKP